MQHYVHRIEERSCPRLPLADALAWFVVAMGRAREAVHTLIDKHLVQEDNFRYEERVGSI